MQTDELAPETPPTMPETRSARNAKARTSFPVRAFRKDPAASYSPTRRPCSTIGAGGLNFRVRDGNGCFPAAIATRNRAVAGVEGDWLKVEGPVQTGPILQPSTFHLQPAEPAEQRARGRASLFGLLIASSNA